jgi:uncharacterized membrane protein YbhN (UPF0104 family)
VIAGILLCWFTILIAGWRWHRLLAAFQIGIPLPALVCIAQIGQFFSMLMPGPTGDDLTRLLYISRLTKGMRVGEACTSVLLDRCIGLSSVLLLAVCCIPWQWAPMATQPESRWIAVGILSVGGVVAVASALFFLIDGRVMQRLSDGSLRLLPASRIRHDLSVISRHVFASKMAIAQVMVAAVCTQLVLCVVFYLAGRSVGIQLPLTLWLGFVPVVLAANAVPITIAGIGVREGLMTLFLGVLAHIDSDRATAASIVAFSITVVVCLLGGVVYILYKPRKDNPAG